MSEIAAVLDYGDAAKDSGLSLLNGPGNDIVAVTNLTAAGGASDIVHHGQRNAARCTRTDN